MKMLRVENCPCRTRVPRSSGLSRCLGFLALGFLCLALSTCDNFDFYGIISGKTTGSSGQLAISPLSATIAVNKACTFMATGGTPPYRFTVVGSGTIGEKSGVYMAPSSGSSDAVQVSDAAGGLAEASAVSVP
jgi:hypothetical protein